MKIITQQRLPGLHIIGVEEKTFFSFLTSSAIFVCLTLSYLLYFFFRGCPILTVVVEDLGLHQADNSENLKGEADALTTKMDSEENRSSGFFNINLNLSRDQKNKDERESINKNTSSPISTWSGLFRNCIQGKAIEIETEKQEVGNYDTIPVEKEDTELVGTEEERYTFSSLQDFKLLFSGAESIELSEKNDDESLHKSFLNLLHILTQNSFLCFFSISLNLTVLLVAYLMYNN